MTLTKTKEKSLLVQELRILFTIIPVSEWAKKIFQALLHDGKGWTLEEAQSELKRVAPYREEHPLTFWLLGALVAKLNSYPEIETECLLEVRNVLYQGA